MQVPASAGASWTTVATVGGRAAAWTAQRGGVTLLRFDQQLARLDLHAGAADPGGSGWLYGPQVGANEIHRVIAAFNGGFKLNYGEVGFALGGRVAVPLSRGLASIVTYRDGTTDIGTWGSGTPRPHVAITSVLQNLHLLVSGGRVAPSTAGCVQVCWGSTLGGGTDVARSAVGVTGNGQLVWAAGSRLSPVALGQALAGAGVQRAVELDINPEWVAGYLYRHGSGTPSGVPAMPGQLGITGHFLAPYARDFFAVVAR